MVASQIRLAARESLTGKWGKAALITLIYFLVNGVIEWICEHIPTVGSIIALIISYPISFGLIVSYVKLKRDEEVGYFSFFTDGFSSFGKVWGIIGNTFLKMIIPICLLVVFMIIMGVGQVASIQIASAIGVIGILITYIYYIVRGYLYSLSYYILIDNPNMRGKEIVEESERLMNGYRGSYFYLNLTFIGWMLLACLILGIGILWVMPYMLVSQICFYEERAEKIDAEPSENDPQF